MILLESLVPSTGKRNRTNQRLCSLRKWHRNVPPCGGKFHCNRVPVVGKPGILYKLNRILHKSIRILYKNDARINDMTALYDDL